MANTLTLDEIVKLTKQLSLVDKARLIKEIAMQIEQELTTAQPVQRKAGLHAGAIWMSDDFDEPLSLKGGE